jgi:hypothetical protein
MHTQSDLATIKGWLADIAYIPGSRLEAFMVGEDVISVRFSGLAFNSRAPSAVHIVRGRSVRVDIGHRSYTAGALPDVLEASVGYEVGPDLVGGPLVEIGVAWHLPAFLPEGGYQRFLRWLHHQLSDVAIHESDEWLRRASDGHIFFDPHEQKGVG